MEKERKSGFVTLVGRPNVGKSTMMNHLIGQKIAITANKPQTTRKQLKTVYTDERGQIVFCDTPGIHTAKNRLGEYMVEEAFSAIPDVDVIALVVEPAMHPNAIEDTIVEKLKDSGKPLLLLVNKADLYTAEEVEEAKQKYTALLPFQKVLTVSALRSVGTKEVLQALFDLLPVGPNFYDEDVVTEVSMREISAEIIREKALRILQDEIPHGIAVTIEEMHQRKGGIWDIEATVYCEKESHKGIVIGRGGSMLKKIGSAARVDIEEMVEAQVNLKIRVKVKEHWREMESHMREFGYRQEKKK